MQMRHKMLWDRMATSLFKKTEIGILQQSLFYNKHFPAKLKTRMLFRFLV